MGKHILRNISKNNNTYVRGFLVKKVKLELCRGQELRGE